MHPNSAWRWSDEFRRLLGFADERDFPNEMQSWHSRLHEDDAKTAGTALRSALADKSDRYDTIYRLKLKDGTYRWFRAMGGASRDASGKVTRMCGSLIDIHAEKMAELRRKEDMRKLAVAVRKTDHGLGNVGFVLVRRAEGNSPGHVHRNERGCGSSDDRRCRCRASHLECADCIRRSGGIVLRYLRNLAPSHRIEPNLYGCL